MQGTFIDYLFISKIYLDKLNNRKPLRDFVVSTVIVINLLIVASNLMSITWFIIFPARIGTISLIK
jgi:hypothetical protein